MAIGRRVLLLAKSGGGAGFDLTPAPFVGSGRWAWDFVVGPTPGTVYGWYGHADTRYQGLYRSVDFGQSWQLFASSFDIFGTRAMVTREQWVGLAASSSYVFVCRQRPTTPAIGGIWRIAHGTGVIQQVYNSSAFGAPSGRRSVIAATLAGQLLSGIKPDDIQYSPDNGATWGSRLGDGSATETISECWINPDNVNEMMYTQQRGAPFNDTRTHRTLNGGTNWTHWQFGDPTGVIVGEAPTVQGFKRKGNALASSQTWTIDYRAHILYAPQMVALGITNTIFSDLSLAGDRALPPIKFDFHPSLDRIIAARAGGTSGKQGMIYWAEPVGQVTKQELWTYPAGVALSVYGTQQRGQTFTPANSHTLRMLRLKIGRNGNPGNTTIGIYNTDAFGFPTGAALGEVTFNGNNLSDGVTWTDLWHDFVFNIPVNAAVKYAITVKAPAGGVANYVRWYSNNADTYAGGNPILSNDGGTTWADVAAAEMAFEEYSGTPPTLTYKYRLPACPKQPSDIQYDKLVPVVTYALCEYTGLMRSVDGGANWHQKGKLPDANLGDPNFIIEDNFVDADGTLLGNHAPDYAPWVTPAWVVNAGGIQIISNTARVTVGGIFSRAVTDLTNYPDTTAWTFPNRGTTIVADINPAPGGTDVSIYFRWLDATHYWRYRLFSSGGNLLAEVYLNNGAGEVLQGVQKSIGPMPGAKFRAMITQWHDDSNWTYAVFSVSLGVGQDYQNGYGSIRSTTGATTWQFVGLDFAAADAGSSFEYFGVNYVYQKIGDEFDDPVIPNGVTITGHEPDRFVQGTGVTWLVASGNVVGTGTVGVIKGQGAGVESIALINPNSADFVMHAGLQFTAWKNAAAGVGYIFRAIDASNHWRAVHVVDAGVGRLRLYKVVAGVPNLVGTINADYATNNPVKLHVFAVGKHISVWININEGTFSNIAADDDTFKSETIGGIWFNTNDATTTVKSVVVWRPALPAFT